MTSPLHRLLSLPVALAFAASLASAGCVYSLDSAVAINPEIRQDKPYNTVRDRWSKDVTVIEKFSTLFDVEATYLSPEFRAALAKRYEDIFKEPQPLLEDASNRAAFFVTLYSSERDFTDLADTQIWAVALKAGAETRKPVMIRRVPDKALWREFFLGINRWTTEYLVVFESPEMTPNSPALLEKAAFELQLNSPRAQVALVWEPEQ